METPAVLPPPPLGTRLGYLAHLLALAAAIGILGLLPILGFPAVRDGLGKLISDAPKLAPGLIVTSLASGVLLPFIVLLGCQRRGWLRRPHFIAAWTGVLIAGVCLVWDDPSVRHPVTFEDLAPTRPGDDTSFALFLRYGKNTPATNAVTAPKLQVGAATNDLSAHPEKWIAFLRANRAEIEAEWAKLAPVRAWWDELAALPRIGDLTAPRADAPILAFQPTRLHAQLSVAIASLQALDGHGDEAMATLTRLYTVVRKFEPNSRTLVRAMIAKVIQRMSLNTVGFVLDHATVSTAARAAFAAELTAAVSGPAGAKRLVLIESGFSQPMVAQFIRGESMGESEPFDILQRMIRIFGGLVLNPRATVNLFGDRFQALANLAEERRLSDLEDQKNPVNRPHLEGYHVKNLGGRLLADMGTPALSKVVKSYWDIDDLRLAYLKRLQP